MSATFCSFEIVDPEVTDQCEGRRGRAVGRPCRWCTAIELERVVARRHRRGRWLVTCRQASNQGKQKDARRSG